MTDKNITEIDDDSLSEQDILFNAWLDGELSADERDEFQRRLADDPEFKQAHEQFVSVMQIVRKIPFEFAPDDFVDNVQTYIRHRSRGRFFTDNFLTQSRMPYEVVAIVMILIIAAAYILMEAPHDTDVKPPLTPELHEKTPSNLDE